VSKDDDRPCRRVPADPVSKRLVRYMTAPGRVILGVPVALFLSWLDNGHHRLDQLGWDGFWSAYGCWFVGLFLLFWLYELHAWAGGRRLNG